MEERIGEEGRGRRKEKGKQKREKRREEVKKRMEGTVGRK